MDAGLAAVFLILILNLPETAYVLINPGSIFLNGFRDLCNIIGLIPMIHDENLAQLEPRAPDQIRLESCVLYEAIRNLGSILNLVHIVTIASIIPAQARCFGLTLGQLFEMAIENVL